MNSLFYQLNNYLLLEYSLYDENYPVDYSAASNGFYRIKNIKTNAYQILNLDTAPNTNVIRDKSVVKIDNNYFAYLDNTPSINYLDLNPDFNYTKLNSTNIDINSSNTYNSDIDFVAHPKLIKYDTFKVHLLLGYDFSDTDGFIFELNTQLQDNSFLNIASVVYQKADNYVTLNPKMVIQNGKTYGSYIQFLTPSIISLVKDSKYSNYNVLNKIIPSGSNFISVKENSPLQFSLHTIQKTEVKPIGASNYSFFSTQLEKKIALPQSDEHQLLSCLIQESSEGDYLEYFATYNNTLIEDYILYLINSGDNWVIQHDLTVSEQVEHSWIITDSKSLLQTTNWDNIFTFRPVLKYSSSSVAYAIDYTIRLINIDRNTSIYKKSSITLTNPKKYGRKLLTIDLSRNPARLNKVYLKNQSPIQIQNVQSTGAITVVNQTVPTFYEKFNIYVGNEVIYLDPNGNFVTQSTDDNSQVYSLDSLKIELDPFDNWFLFRIYQKQRGSYSLLDLSGAANYYLIFNESIKLVSIPDNLANKTRGELLFKVDKNSASYLLKNGSGKFYINSDLGSESTTIYRGFYSGTSSTILKNASNSIVTTIANSTASINEVKLNASVDISNQASPNLTVKDTNTVHIPGSTTDSGNSLKSITPAS